MFISFVIITLLNPFIFNVKEKCLLLIKKSEMGYFSKVCLNDVLPPVYSY